MWPLVTLKQEDSEACLCSNSGVRETCGLYMASYPILAELFSTLEVPFEIACLQDHSSMSNPWETQRLPSA